MSTPPTWSANVRSVNFSTPRGRRALSDQWIIRPVCAGCVSRTQAAASVNVRRQVKAPSKVRQRHVMKAAISQYVAEI